MPVFQPQPIALTHKIPTEMFLESEIIRTISALELLLAALLGAAPVVVTLWVKLVLERWRTAEDN